jgi:large subunit ribosomal protein L10
MFTETGNAPARLIKKFREENEKPIIKGAFVESDIYIGDDQLESLVNLKSKNELIADIILLLESPIKNLVGSLQSGGNTISGLLKALGDREE